MLRSIAPIFKVKDVEKTIEWYKDLLDFTAFPFPDKPPYAFAILQKDKIEIFLQQIQNDDNLSTKKHEHWDAYIRLDGGKIYDLYNALKSKAKIVKPIFKTSHDDTEFEIEDCNGYILCFGEVLEE